MQVRHFYIRVSKVYTEDDEALLNDFLRNVQVVNVQSSLINASTNYWSILVFYKDTASHEDGVIQEAPDSKKRVGISEENEQEELTTEQEHILQRLKAWRTERVAQESVPAYVIAHNETLRQIAIKILSIRNKGDLAQIKQFGNKKAQKYGDEILQIIQEFIDQDEDSLFDDE